MSLCQRFVSVRDTNVRFMNTLACNHNWHCTFAFGTRFVNLCGMRSASKVVWPSLSESSRSSGRQSLQSRINCTSHLRVTRTRPVSISSRLATLRWCGVRYSVRRETRAVPPLAESRSPARLGRSCGRFIAAAPQRRSYSRDCGAQRPHAIILLAAPHAVSPPVCFTAYVEDGGLVKVLPFLRSLGRIVTTVCRSNKV